MPSTQPALWAILVVAGCAGLSALLILLLRPIMARHLLAQPNARSSHQVPTPQGAGLAVMASVFAGCALGIFLWAQGAEPRLLGVLVAAAGLTLLGAIDDAHSLPVADRLVGQLLAAIVLVGTLPEDFRLFPDLLPEGVEDGLMVVGIIWFVNAVNFLDGLDWMTVAQVVPMTLGVSILHALGAVPGTAALLALALLGAALGFAVFNKHPASIFLGDAGSLPIGLCLAFLLICVAETNLAAALLLSLYTLADSILTFLRRLLAGERVFARAPHPFLSARRGFRLERAASHGTRIRARATARLACGRNRVGGLPWRQSSMPRPRPRGHLLRRCSRSREVIEMKRCVLVTGASGFIGKRIVAALAKAGWQVRAAARDPSLIAAVRGVQPVAMPDLAARADWPFLLEGVTHVVHLAGIAHAPGSLPDKVYTRINTEAVGELADAARGRIERLVFMSSVRAQAGLSADHPITELDAPAPTDAYGRAKLEGERLIAESGVAFTVLRPAVVYGRGVKGNIAALATLARTPMPLPFAGLANRRSLLALDNLASAVALVLDAKRAANETFLVADQEPISVADLVGAMREGLGRAPHLIKVPSGAVKRILKSLGKEADYERVSGEFIVDASKLRRIGWTPAVSTHDGIVRMMRAENGATS